ncbi:PstS family phosphate ABC transporter substrate-binding protein [Natranaerobius thermophilus]|uniref:Phosphate-binding protein n=1 Tax=Natranaerobius thermophilus (strain ATCC BAA-1301 / DSM 18059 / JW/NM-WN-LF) TaxID=457570 RepID=B2A0K2_NATTJ|nr:PstS family phosphate ABC transporter substrate-binding protein [Natranaerobius thermophilus]ACB84563.1 phosphate binding protein [Natranaerobius thermophilus JW/NM-WN-LF]
MRTKLISLSLVLILGLSVLSGCGNGDEGRDRALEIQGSDTMVNLNQTWAEEYMDKNQDKQVSVTGGGSGTGISALINDNVDIAGSSRYMKEEEIEEAQNNDVNVYEFKVGQDGLAVGVHKNNPIDKMTVDELKKVFTGEVTEWSELGWEDGGTIEVYSRQSNSGTYVYFNENIMDGEDWASDTQFMSGSSAINDALQNDENGIGYYGVGYVDGVTALDVAEDEGSEFYTPLEQENIDDGDYPIARPLYFYTNGVPEEEVLEFLEFVLNDGQDIIGDAGFYALTPEYETKNEEIFQELDIEFE